MNNNRKAHATRDIAGAVFLLCGGGLPAAAQDMVRMLIPFDFPVNGHQLPAGDYIIKRNIERTKP